MQSLFIFSLSAGSFFTAAAELVDRTPPPARDMLIDHFAVHGVFFPRDLPPAHSDAEPTDFGRLLVRLSRCNLLFRSHDVTGQLRAVLQTVLPFERVAPFHHFMVRHCLANDLKSILEVYLIWYGLNKLPFDEFFNEFKRFAPDQVKYVVVRRACGVWL